MIRARAVQALGEPWATDSPLVPAPALVEITCWDCKRPFQHKNRKPRRCPACRKQRLRYLERTRMARKRAGIPRGVCVACKGSCSPAAARCRACFSKRPRTRCPGCGGLGPADGGHCWHCRAEGPERRYQPKSHCPQGHPLEGHNLAIIGGQRRCRTCYNAQCYARQRRYRERRRNQRNDDQRSRTATDREF